MKWRNCIKVTVSLLLVWPVHSLDERWVGSVNGMNCSSFLSGYNGSSGCSSSINGKIKCETKSGPTQPSLCPPWYRLSNNSDCRTGDNFRSVVYFSPRTWQTRLQTFYCMTTTQNLTQRKDVIGGCPFSANNIVEMMYIPLPCNISKLNDFMCADLNREGQLCGRCRDGFAPPVYSYSFSCINCTDHALNWLKYSAVAFGPLTLFCIIITIFHVSATSPYLHGFIFYCHLLSLPTLLRLESNNHGYKNYYNIRMGLQIYNSLISIWNFDFFRLVYEPFCLHPRMSIIQALALDYLIAAYPLFLILVFFVLVSLHDRNCKVIVVLWKPFQAMLRPFLHKLDVRTSLVESFATLYLLSIMKFQSVSLDLLVPTTLYYSDGTQDSKLYLYLAGNVEYFGEEHMPYALLASVLFIALVLFPTLLLFLYPLHCFQSCLNRIQCNSQALRTFMDVFQGHYKDGTNKSRDYRYFSGVFLVVRFVVVIQYPLFNSYYALLTFGVVITVLAFIVALLHPQRSQLHYTVDSVFLVLLSVIVFSAIGTALGPHNTVPFVTSLLFGIVAAALPLLHITIVILYWIFLKKRVPQRIVRALWIRVSLTIGGQYCYLLAF